MFESVLVTPLPFALVLALVFALQKQLLEGVLQNRCSLKFLNIHRKTTVLESLFNKVAGLQHWCFPLNIAKILGKPTLKNIWERRLQSLKLFFTWKVL